MYKCASSFNGITVSQGKEKFLKSIYAKIKLPSTAISATIQLYDRTYLSIQPNISLAMARVDLVPTVITQLELHRCTMIISEKRRPTKPLLARRCDCKNCENLLFDVVAGSAGITSP